jgi:RNA polymerase sigma-70 factor (ECF subfamily)
LSILSEAELIKGLNNNNHIAVKYLIDNYQHYVYSTCLNILKKRQESEEATQDIFLKIIKNIKDYNLSKSFKSWIFTISYRTAIDYYRRKKDTVPQDLLVVTPSTQFADELLDANEQNTQIQKLLSHLSEEDATLLRMYYLVLQQI